MAKYSKERQREYMAIIRQLLTRNPYITNRQIKEGLANAPTNPISLDINYIGKLVRKISTQRAKDIELATMEEVMGEFRNEAIELKRQLWAVISDGTTKQRDKVAAIKEVRNTSKELFDKMFESGIFERSLGKIKVGHELSEEDEELVSTALENAFGKNNIRPRANITKQGKEDSTS
jgi:hypothetical protein